MELIDSVVSYACYVVLILDHLSLHKPTRNNEVVLSSQGYSIFVVVGDLPKCEAQELLSLCPGELQHMQSSPPVAGLSDKRELMEPEQQAGGVFL